MKKGFEYVDNSTKFRKIMISSLEAKKLLSNGSTGYLATIVDLSK